MGYRVMSEASMFFEREHERQCLLKRKMSVCGCMVLGHEFILQLANTLAEANHKEPAGCYERLRAALDKRITNQVCKDCSAREPQTCIHMGCSGGLVPRQTIIVLMRYAGQVKRNKVWFWRRQVCYYAVS